MSKQVKTKLSTKTMRAIRLYKTAEIAELNGRRRRRDADQAIMDVPEREMDVYVERTQNISVKFAERI